MARSGTRSSGTRKTPSKTASKTGKKGTSRDTDKGTDKAASKSAAKKAGSARSTADGSGGNGTDGGRRQAPRAQAPRRAGATKVAARAAAELLELTGRAAEGITGLERTEDGWTVQVEVVEVRRIPDTTDVLALYEVQTDDEGALQGYRRVRRYARGVPGED